MFNFLKSLAHRRSVRLPNGLVVQSLNSNDTYMVYRDIFDDDCYRRRGVTIGDGDCILDVGANTGLFILYLNSIISTAKVYAFEPLPDTFEVLSQNVDLHNRLDVELMNLGLSSRPGQALFTYYPRMSNASTMYPDASARTGQLGKDYILEQFRTLPWPLAGLLSICPGVLRNALAERIRGFYLKKRSIPCKLGTLSAFLRSRGITRVDLLKIDAEQSERHILAGLDDDDWPMIRQTVIEVHDGDDATRAMADSLRDRGFDVAVEPNPTFPALSLVYGIRDGLTMPATAAVL